jgi:hypothetical protein
VAGWVIYSELEYHEECEKMDLLSFLHSMQELVNERNPARRTSSRVV